MTFFTMARAAYEADNCPGDPGLCVVKFEMDFTYWFLHLPWASPRDKTAAQLDYCLCLRNGFLDGESAEGVRL